MLVERLVDFFYFGELDLFLFIKYKIITEQINK